MNSKQQAQTSPNRTSLHTYVGIAVLLTAAAILYALLFRPPILGLADNGDFHRLAAPQGLIYPLDPQLRPVAWNERHWDWIFLTWHLSPAEATDPGYFTTASWLLAPLARAHRAILGEAPFDLREYAALCSIILIAGYIALLFASRPLPAATRIPLLAAAIVLYTDSAYLAYFNSFYCESATVPFLLLSWAAGWLWLSRARSAVLPTIILIAALAFLSGAKPQNTIIGLLLGPAIAITGLLDLRRSPRAFRNPSNAAALAALLGGIAVLLLSKHALTAQHERYTTWHLYHSVFKEILPHSDTPEADLLTLGLSPEHARLSGGNVWSDLHAGRAPSFDDEFKSVTLATIVKFHLSHPRRSLRMVTEAAANASAMRAPNLGNFERAAGRPPGSIATHWALWSKAKETLAPFSAPSLLLALLIAPLVLAIHPIPTIPRAIFVAPALLAVIQFGIVLLGEGRLDLTRRLLLFHGLLDLALLGMLAHALEGLRLLRLRATSGQGLAYGRR